MSRAALNSILGLIRNEQPKQITFCLTADQADGLALLHLRYTLVVESARKTMTYELHAESLDGWRRLLKLHHVTVRALLDGLPAVTVAAAP
jgi:hypothetical protein